MFKKITHALMALTIGLGMSFASVPQAEARHGSGVAFGVAAGIIGLGILGAASAHAHPHYYSSYRDDDACHYGPRECELFGQSVPAAAKSVAKGSTQILEQTARVRSKKA